jgi:hypothetical protein
MQQQMALVDWDAWATGVEGLEIIYGFCEGG